MKRVNVQPRVVLGINPLIRVFLMTPWRVCVFIVRRRR